MNKEIIRCDGFVAVYLPKDKVKCGHNDWRLESKSPKNLDVFWGKLKKMFQEGGVSENGISELGKKSKCDLEEYFVIGI